MVTRSTRCVEVSSWYPMLLPVHAGPGKVLGGEDGDSRPGTGGAAEPAGEERGAAEPAPGSTEPRDRGEEDTAGSVRPPAGAIPIAIFVCRQYQFIQQETQTLYTINTTNHCS